MPTIQLTIHLLCLSHSLVGLDLVLFAFKCGEVVLMPSNKFTFFFFGLLDSWKCNIFGEYFTAANHGNSTAGSCSGWMWVYKFGICLCFGIWFSKVHGSLQCWSLPSSNFWSSSFPQISYLYSHVSFLNSFNAKNMHSKNHGMVGEHPILLKINSLFIIMQISYPTSYGERLEFLPIYATVRSFGQHPEWQVLGASEADKSECQEKWEYTRLCIPSARSRHIIGYPRTICVSIFCIDALCYSVVYLACLANCIFGDVCHVGLGKHFHCVLLQASQQVTSHLGCPKIWVPGMRLRIDT